MPARSSRPRSPRGPEQTGCAGQRPTGGLVIAWGTVPEWLAAVGTTAAFVGGVILIRKELKEFRLLQESQAMGDARRVFAWPTFETGGDTFVGEGWERVRAGYWLHLRNGGDAPIYDCRVRLIVPDDSALNHGGLRYPLVPPGETCSWILGPSDLDVLPVEYPTKPSYQAWAEVVFTDTAGRRWRRGEKGVLQELPDAAIA